jgi:hypothetical protein
MIDYGDTALKGFEYFLDRSSSYHFQVFIFTSMSIFGAKSENEKYHAIFAVSNLSYQLFDGFLIFNLLKSV